MRVRTGLRGLGEVAYTDEGQAYNVVDYSPFPVIVSQVVEDDGGVTAAPIASASIVNSTAVTGNPLPTPAAADPLPSEPVRLPTPQPAVRVNPRVIDPASDPSGQLRTQQWFTQIQYADTPAGAALNAHNDAVATLTDLTDNAAPQAQIDAATKKVAETFVNYTATLEDQNRKNAAAVQPTNSTKITGTPVPPAPPASSARPDSSWLWWAAAAAYFLLGN